MSLTHPRSLILHLRSEDARRGLDNASVAEGITSRVNATLHQEWWGQEGCFRQELLNRCKLQEIPAIEVASPVGNLGI